MRRPRFRSLAGGAAGIAAGLIGGVVLTSVSAAGGPTPMPDGPPLIDATHVPPALTVRGEPITLRYGLICTPRTDGLPCDGSGTVYLREGRSGPFTPFALQRGDESEDGRYFLDVPTVLGNSPDGFSYYAVLRDDSTGVTITVPSGGADAPQLSLPLQDPVTVALGRHLFGSVREPDAPAANAAWGSGPGEVGLAGSRDLGYSGPSSFDVERDGSVDVLDSVNRRVLRWSRGKRGDVPITGDLELADFAAEPAGGYDVLDEHGTLEHFGTDGTHAWSQKVSDRTWAKLEPGPTVLQQPSEEWMPVAENGAPLTRAEQKRRGREDHHGLVIDRVGDGELRVAELRGNAQPRSWRITSGTPLGEVQLAEPHGNGVVIVTRTYNDDRDEFVVLVLSARGIVQHFSVASASWTETAPLARFRLAGGALYRFRTTQAGASVDRFDLEVPQ
jgi:hypothetical protein